MTHGHIVVTHRVGVHALCYLALDAVEGTTADEQDVAGVHVHIVLVGMLAASLWRHVHNTALQQFQQTLLHTLATDVACDAGIVALACYLVYLVYEHNTAFCLGLVIVGRLQQARQDAFHVLAHIAGFRQHRGIDNGERHVKHLGYGACKQGLARTGGAYHDDVALLYLHIIVSLAQCLLAQTLVVVVDGHGQGYLGLILTDDILIQPGLDLCRTHQRLVGIIEVVLASAGLQVLTNHLVCHLHTIAADEAFKAVEHQRYILLATATKGATVQFLCHTLTQALRERTLSTIPYSLASWAVIQ